MQINITGRHITLTDNIKVHVEEKLARCLGTFSQIESIRVILDSEKHENIAEVVVKAPHHVHVVAKEHSENLYDAIDRAVEHAERQLHKHYDKLHNHHK